MSEIIIAEAGSIDERKDIEDSPGTSKLWQIEIRAATKRYEPWAIRAKEVIKRYRDERSRKRTSLFRTNILWANTEIMKSALFAGDVAPDVRRRFLEDDGVSREAATMLERVLSHAVDENGFEREVEALVEDGTLPGRGVLRVIYEPEVDEDTDEIVSQEIRAVQVGWRDFLTSSGSRWTDVWWVGFRHTLNRDEFKASFPDIDDKAVPFELNAIRVDDFTGDDNKDTFNLAEVWEIWDKTKRERIWVVVGYDKVLKVDKDPYTLKKFFPMAEPFVPVSTNDSLIPVPLYTLYQDQATELDRLTTRITNLVEALKYRGVYDASADEDGALSNLVESGDNHFIGYKGFQVMQEKGGLQNVLTAIDIQPISAVLQNLYVQRQQTIDTIFEITGISDLVRGFSSKVATATEKQLQAQFSNLRFERMQRLVNMTVKGTLEVMAEIVAEHFEPQLLMQISGMSLPTREQIQQAQQQAQQAQAQGQPAPDVPKVAIEDVIDVLRRDKSRSFRIDIESKATRAADEKTEREDRLAFVQVINGLLTNTLPAAQANPTILPFVKEMVLFASRGFKVGRQLEETLEDAFDQMKALPPPVADTSDEDKLKAQQEKDAADFQFKTSKLAVEDAARDKDREVEISKVISGG